MEMKYIESGASELAIIARRHGFEPLFEQLTASEKNLKLKNASVFFNNKTMDFHLNGTHQTDFHDDYNDTFCYLCSVSQHEHERTKPRDESQRRKLIPYKNPKARLTSSSSDRTIQNSSSSDLISYRFIVRTGAQKESSTRAQVFLYIYGTENNWTSIHLQGNHKPNSSTSIDGFPSGSVRTFCLKGPDIGQLHHLNVNLVGSRSEKEWFLKEIEITNLNTSTTWLCEFNCWLPKTDEQEIKQIKPTVHRRTQFSLSMYILQIRTGRKSFAGTDANVHIIVRGSNSSTRRLALTSTRANLFEQNQLDTFAIVGDDLGDLLEITVESDRSQLATDWDIKEMILRKIIPNDEQEKSPVYFPFDTWLGKKMSTLKSKKEIYPTTDPHIKGPICYQVSVKTGKVTNAGTDANVFLIIYGKSGRTVIHQLDNQLKNDFERNSISEFTIMDIDIGKIDRIKIWHDNSGPGSAWFLDSILIGKKYSTCHTVSTIYIQRLEQISKVLYRQIYDQMKKSTTVRGSSVNEDKRHSASRQSLKSNDYNDNESKDRLGSSRGILRSLPVYDKVSLQKKVTWDEQSIGSQDDLLSINSQRSVTKTEQKSKKEDSLPRETGHVDHQAYWISSHNYIDNKWKIESIEESNSFHFDQSTRSLLLSDRLAINNQIKTPIHDNNDEIYECSANRWLAKDKEDGKLEVYLPAKLIHASSMTSETHIDSKKKHLIPTDIHHDSQRQKYGDEKEGLKVIKRSTTHDHTVSMSSERELLARLTGEPSYPSRTPSASSISSSQRLKSSYSSKDLTTSSLNSRDSLAKISREPLNDPRSKDTSISSRTQPLKSLRNTKDLISPLTSEQELLARITGESPYRSAAAASLTPLSQRAKLPHHTNDLINSSIKERETFSRISSESLVRPRLPPSSPLRSNNESLSSLTRPSVESLARPKSAARSNPKLPSQKTIYDQVYNSAYGTALSDDF